MIIMDFGVVNLEEVLFLKLKKPIEDLTSEFNKLKIIRNF